MSLNPHTLELLSAYVDGELVPREFVDLTLSFDHDVVDGGPAARFTAKLRELIETADGLPQP